MNDPFFKSIVSRNFIVNSQLSIILQSQFLSRESFYAQLLLICSAFWFHILNYTIIIIAFDWFHLLVNFFWWLLQNSIWRRTQSFFSFAGSQFKIRWRTALSKYTDWFTCCLIRFRNGRLCRHFGNILCFYFSCFSCSRTGFLRWDFDLSWFLTTS
jgi:hypothetical protein